jgi:hypothetical protein
VRVLRTLLPELKTRSGHGPCKAANQPGFQTTVLQDVMGLGQSKGYNGASFELTARDYAA